MSEELLGMISEELHVKTIFYDDAKAMINEIVQHVSSSTKTDVYVSSQHAGSLIELVIWFQRMITAGKMPDHPGRTDALTNEYCNELLKDLRNE